ncbi:glycosyltransferase [Oceanimonas sp. AH20CE76]|uniref:glycosyltransferase n=1 Tax=Oceanimonas sp. AH20CE76 TaxID=2977120 RepID=UPI0031FEF4ED
MESDLKKAFDLFETQKYQESLDIYKKLKSKSKSSHFDINIKIIEKRLSHKKNKSLYQNGNQLDLMKSHGIEQVYVINLESRFDRKLKILRELSRVGIRANIVKGVNARESEDAKRRYEKFKKMSSHAGEFTTHIKDEKLRRIKSSIHLGAFGYNLSQKKIFKDAIKKGFRKIAVFDDDIFFTNSFEDKLKKKLNELKSYKVIMLGSSEYMYQDDENFEKSIENKDTYNPIPGRTLGSFAAVYDHSVFHDILAGIDSNLGTFDNVVLGHVFKKYNSECFVFNPNICIPSIEESDIRDTKREQTSHSDKMRWDISNFYEWKKKPSFNVIVNSPGQVINLEKINLNNDARICIFYKSNDGPRSIIPGRKNNHIDFIHDDIIKVNEKDKVFFNSLPHADFNILLNDTDFNIDTCKFKEILEDCFKEKKANTPVIVKNEKQKKNEIDYFSIIIPVYREIEKALPSIASAINQNEKVEVIVVNDNPNNKNVSAYLKEKLPQTKNELRIINHTKKRGASAARNTGLWASKGSYISFLDDDDIYLENRIKNARLKITQENDESIGAVYCGFKGGAHDGVDKSRFLSGNLFEEIISLEYQKHFINTDTVTYKRESLISIGGFNESYIRHQDIEMNSRFFLQFNIIPLESIDVIIRPTPQNKTFTPNFENILELKKKLLSDFRNEISNLDENKRNTLIRNHLSDILKRTTEESDKTREKIKAELIGLITHE